MQVGSTTQLFRASLSSFKADLRRAPSESKVVLADKFLETLAQGQDDGAKVAKFARRAGRSTGQSTRKDIYSLALRALSASATAFPPFVSQVVSTIPADSWLAIQGEERVSTEVLKNLKSSTTPGSPEAEIHELLQAHDTNMQGERGLLHIKPELDEAVGSPPISHFGQAQSRSELTGIKALSQTLKNASPERSRTDAFLDFASHLTEKSDSDLGNFTRQMAFEALSKDTKLSTKDQKKLFLFAKKHNSADALKAFGESTSNPFYWGVSRFGVESGNVAEAVSHLEKYRNTDSPRSDLKNLMADIQNEERGHEVSDEASQEWSVLQEMSLENGEYATPEPLAKRYQAAHKLWLELALGDLER